MTLTARRIEITPESKEKRGDGGAYATIEVPGDYEVTLIKGEDYDNGPQRTGWKLTYELDGLPFNFWLNFSKASRWKLVATAEAHLGRELGSGEIEDMNPADWIGDVVGAHIDWQNDPDQQAEGEKNYREIKTIFALQAETPEVPAPPAFGEEEEPAII